MSDDLVKILRADDGDWRTDQAADRIEELEAKLAKAVEALAWCATVHDSSRARFTLAELKGQDDE